MIRALAAVGRRLLTSSGAAGARPAAPPAASPLPPGGRSLKQTGTDQIRDETTSHPDRQQYDVYNTHDVCDMTYT